MAQITYELEIVAPDKVVVREAGVTGITIPASWGQMEILPQHTDYMTTLSEGDVVYSVGGQHKTQTITGGLFTVAAGKATILADGVLATVTPLDPSKRKKVS